MTRAVAAAAAATKTNKLIAGIKRGGGICRPPLSLSKNPGVDKGPQPLMFNPALTTCASERMKTQRFSYFAGFAARERMREAKPVKLKKVAFSHFFDTLKGGGICRPPVFVRFRLCCYSFSSTPVRSLNELISLSRSLAWSCMFFQ